MRNIHREEPVVHAAFRSKNSIICPCCAIILNSYADLRDHVNTEHDINIFKEEMCFQSKSEFLLWKTQKEKELKCSYFKPTGTKIRSHSRREYYICHRSYLKEKYKHSSTVPPKKLKSIHGSVKLMHSCPSTIELTEKDGQYKAVIYLPHLEHECSLKHINLSAVERTQIAGKIAQGVSFEKILNDIRNSVNSESSLERIHLVDRQDLRNIKRQFNLTSQYHQNDVISVDLMINHMQTLQEESPILYYKKQGVDDCPKIFEASDFFLVIMTNFQKSMAEKFGPKKICVDSTHGTTGYDFLLTTILTVDDFGEGIPIAFLLSNKTCGTTLTFFLQLIKEKVGFPLATETFMSDDAPEFYNSWSEIMEMPKNHLLCVWHVDRNWRTNISQKVQGDQEIKANVYKQLRCLMECQNIDAFNRLLTQVGNNLAIQENTKDFGKYFNTYYAKRPQQWAFCFRQGLGINTNMFLESMHKVLKHIYLEGKKFKRVDKCIQALMVMVRDHMFKRLKKTIKGKVSYRINLIHNSHEKSISITKEDIPKISDVKWKIKSTNKENEYFVEKEINYSCTDNCQLICRYCNVCVHTYTCTCLDNFVKGNICKHIHAISRIRKGVDPESSKICRDNINNSQIELQSFVSQHGKLHSQNENSKLKSKVDMLYKYVSENTYDENTKLKLEKLIDSALNISKQNTIKNPKLNEPANKNADKQMRFQSTKKKKRTLTHALRKPSTSEKEELTSNIQNQYEINEAVKNDHNYL